MAGAGRDCGRKPTGPRRADAVVAGAKDIAGAKGRHLADPMAEGLTPVGGRGGPPLLFDAARRAVFLDTLRESCHLGRSARAAGVSSGTVYAHRIRDVEFAAALEDAKAEGARRLHQGLLDRAIDDAALLDDENGPEVETGRDVLSAPDSSATGGGDQRSRRWLATRLGSSIRAPDASRTRRGLPRAEVDRLLIEAIERLARGADR